MAAKNYLDPRYKVLTNILKISLIISFFILAITKSYAVEDQNKIAVLVNDNVITNYDIEQRIKIFAILNRTQITIDNRTIITTKIVDELIDGMLKSEKIKEYNINVDSNDLNDYENHYFKARGLNKDELFEIMQINNINTDQFYTMLYNEIAWQILINRLYYRITSVSNEEVEELMNKESQITRELAKKIIMDKQLALKSSKMLRDLKSEATIEYK